MILSSIGVQGILRLYCVLVKELGEEEFDSVN